MEIDKINDEFIVDCTNNSTEEKQQVYKFLVDNRKYDIEYLYNSFSVIICRKKSGDSNYSFLNNAEENALGFPVYTFEQFKQMYLNESDMKIYTIQKLRNAPIQIKVYSEEQAIKLAYAVGYDCDWRPSQANYPIYCFLSDYNCPSWSVLPKNEQKLHKPTIIEFNQIENFMENKKIIGYKLIKPEYTKAVCAIEGYICFGENIRDGHVIFLENREEGFKKLQDAKVLDLWFKPVFFKEEYKVGDWITITEVDSLGWLNSTPKRTFQIDGNPVSFAGGTYWRINGGKALHAKFRKATLEEIQQAQKTIVKMYSSNKGEFEIEVVDGKAYYRPENKELPKEWIRQIINSFNDEVLSKNVIHPYSVSIASIKVGCMEGTKQSDWENVYKLLK